MKTYELQNIGTVLNIDLKKHDVFGEVKVALAGGAIVSILEAFYEQLPEKTDFNKKCKSSLLSKLMGGKPNIIINIYPVVNLDVLRNISL